MVAVSGVKLSKGVKSVSRTVFVMVCHSAAVFSIGAAHADAEPEHSVRYVVTADAGQEMTIHFRVAPQTENWSGVHSENYWVSPTAPWQETVTLENPETAYVSVRNVWWNPNLRCEIWIDGTRTMEGAGVCIPRPKILNE
ncbi:Uncharacterised protein [Mycobacteroides abscessus subsp. abscessus]|nr:Uncharacterised protein [Mycobacteroides abscessus subsp. abscessus]SKI87499.1 Uncharacterised protein [Mycobacteroides abscessus subsp. massiliense]SHU86888.1 Uncharacterised protein [Mycobacteroides abscessus subsp. abscessus]SHW47803.1 Uncharacterised protein [Mycobacteroides abscessus subsp. abscessus]SIH61643.1 Uncharacterised protein [Mycobacteroides abscessus subsp. abscessus]